ncbi:MAG: anti-sigma factor [Vicinamibacterales bacterium]
MTCLEFTEFISDYQTGELPEPSRTVFERHLSRCDNCRRYLTSYEESAKLAKLALEPQDSRLPADVPDELVVAILAARRSR